SHILILHLYLSYYYRYGVFIEIDKSVLHDMVIYLSTGFVNVIWQSDANEIAIRSLLHCSSPPKLLNVTGPETVAVKWVAEEFGKHFNKTPQFNGEPAPTALLSNAAESFRLFGYPKVTLKQMIEITATWLLEGGETIQKPTHFQERKGQY